jgi:nucleoside-diphosphate-sugar epimerase
VNKIFIKNDIISLQIPAKPGEQKRSCLDYTKAKKDFNWKPKCNLEERIKEALN